MAAKTEILGGISATQLQPKEVDLQTSEKIAQKAKESIKIIPQTVIDSVSNFSGDARFGDVDNYTTGSNDEKVSQAEFLVCYANLSNIVADGAKRLIDETPSVDGLRERRDELRKELYDEDNIHDSYSVSDIDMTDHETALRSVNALIKRRIVEFSKGGEGLELGVEEMELNQAIMSLGHETEKAKVAKTLKEKSEEVRQHQKIMQQGLGDAREAEEKGKFTHEEATSLQEEWFLNVLDAKLKATGKLPIVYFTNDIDSNLGKDPADHLKPAGDIDDLLTATLGDLPGRQRVAIIHSMQDDPKIGKDVQKLYYNAGSKIPLFVDVAETFEVAEKNGAEVFALTGNMKDAGEGAVSVIDDLPPIQVVGQSSDSVRGPEKPTYLTGILTRDPLRTVIVHSDDSDPRTIKALEKRRAIEVEDCAEILGIEDVAFFASRELGESEEGNKDPYPLQQKLAEMGIPYAVNHNRTFAYKAR